MYLKRKQFLSPATKLRQGNIFTSVCQEFCGGGSVVGGGACMAGTGTGGACMAGGHVWQRGVCMVGGMYGSGHGGGHVWQWVCGR